MIDKNGEGLLEWKERILGVMAQADDGEGIKIAELARRSGVSFNAIRTMLNGGGGGTVATLIKIADALGVNPGIFFDGDLDLKSYTLIDAPVCEEPYHLLMQSNLLPQVFSASFDIVVEIAPWDAEAQAYSIWALFRRKNERHAIIARVGMDGDRAVLFPNSLRSEMSHPADTLLTGESGECLGAIRRLVDLPSVFRH